MELDNARPLLSQSVTQRLLITVHGIRTFGGWQEKLEQTLHAGIEVTDQVCHYRYGFYTIIGFLIPPFRWLATKRFQSWLSHQAQEQSWSRIDIVAHSFGTHLVGWGLLRLPREQRPSIHTVIFAASVLRSSFPVHELLSTCVARLVNECGIRDNVLVLNQMFVLLTGMAGRIGFIGMQGNSFRNRYFNVTHSGYFEESRSEGPDFISQHWMPLLQSNNGIIPHDERTQKGMRDITVALLNIAEPVKIAVYILPIILALLYVNGLRLKAERQTVIANTARLEAERETVIANTARLEAERQRDIASKSQSEAEQQRDIANKSRLEAEHQTGIANESRLEAQHQTINDLIANSRVSQDFDPEISILAATKAVSLAWQIRDPDSLQQKAEDQLHRAILASHVRLTLNDPGGRIKGVAWSPDGTKLATGRGDNTIKIRDATRGTDLLTLKVSHGLSNFAWGPDGTRLASVGTDNTMTIWNTTTGEELRTVKGQNEGDHRVDWSVAWSPDGKRLVTGSGGDVAIVWDASTGEELLTLTGSRNLFHSLAWSPDGTRVATGGFRGPVIVWDALTGKRIFGQGFGEGVVSVAWSPDGRFLAAVNENGLASTGAIYEAATGRSLATLPERGVNFLSLAWSPDSSRLAIAMQNVATVWDVFKREEVLTLRGHTSAVLSVSWSSDGRSIATGSLDGTTKVWNAAVTGSELVNLGTQSGGSISSAGWSPDSSRLAITRSNGAIAIWDSTTQQESPPIHTRVNVGKLAWSTDGKHLVGENGEMWDAVTGKEVLSLNDPDHVPTSSVKWSHDGKWLASVSNQTWSIWDSSTGKKITSADTGQLATHADLSPDRKWLAVEALDGEELWNVETREKYRTFPNGYPMVGVAWAPDSTRLAIGYDNVARILDRETGHEMLTLEGQEGFILGMAWSPDGKRIAISSANTAVQVYAMDVRDLMSLARKRITAHPSDAACLKFLNVDKCPPVPALP